MNTRPLVSQPKDHVAWATEREIEVRLRGDLPQDSDEVDTPPDGSKESDQHRKANNLTEQRMLPFHDFFASILKTIVPGSCCGGVVFLLLLSGWDHNWIPGVKSQFALASDLDEFQAQNREFKMQSATTQAELSRLVVLQLAQAIRDMRQEICIADTNAKQQQLDALQYEYKARTGGFYPHTECRKT